MKNRLCLTFISLLFWVALPACSSPESEPTPTDSISISQQEEAVVPTEQPVLSENIQNDGQEEETLIPTSTPPVLPTATQTVEERIMLGSEIYEGYCAACHGDNAQAYFCGDREVCNGGPLKDPDLVCGDMPERLQFETFSGTKYQFIYRAIAAGTDNRNKPVFGEQFGGTMDEQMLDQITLYVLSFETEELCTASAVAFYEWPETYEQFSEQWEPGNVERGEELYLVNYGCAGCHGKGDDSEDWGGTGPWVGALFSNMELQNLKISPEEYIYRTTLDPSQFNVPGYVEGIMPEDFDKRIGFTSEGPQDLQDIIAYILSINNGDSE